jgi:hypothetical protein
MTPARQMDEHRDTGSYAACFVAFLDILGFKSKVLESQVNHSTLEDIIRSLKIVNGIPSGGKRVDQDAGGQRVVQVRRRFFSDSMVFFLKEDRNDIAQLLFLIRYIQDQLWATGFCLRGSIVRDQMYWSPQDDNITVGKGLIDAHNREERLAIYPRVVVSEDLYKYIEREHVMAFPFGPEGEPLTLYIPRDSDGTSFLDLLNPRITRPEGERLDPHIDGDQFTIWCDPYAPSEYPRILQCIDRIIHDHETCEDDRVKQKYSWLKTYRDRDNG